MVSFLTNQKREEVVVLFGLKQIQCFLHLQQRKKKTVSPIQNHYQLVDAITKRLQRHPNETSEPTRFLEYQKIKENVFATVKMEIPFMLPISIETIPTNIAIPIPKPSNLPKESHIRFFPNKHFVGREQDLRVLASLLKQEQGFVAITGMGGIGKTQLASEFVHRYGKFFTGGTYWFSFANAQHVPNEIVTCGGVGAMDIPGFDELSFDEQVTRVQQEWEEPIPRLLIFDACEDEMLLKQWLPKKGGCRVLVTSRRAIWDNVPDIHVYPLRVLLRRESINLLRHFRPDVAETDNILDTLAHEVGDLPLALDLVGNYLHTFKYDITLDEYLNEFRVVSPIKHESLQGIGGMVSPTSHELNLTKTFMTSYELLQEKNHGNTQALTLLEHIAKCYPGERVPQDLLLQTEVISSHSIEDTQYISPALDHLYHLGLLEREYQDGKTMVHLHLLMALFIQNITSDT